MALGLIAGLRAAGVDVPREVSVTGFDDNPDAAFYSPPLTTVRLDLAGEARRCIAEVLGHAATAVPDPPRIVVRASTAPPAGDTGVVQSVVTGNMNEHETDGGPP